MLFFNCNKCFIADGNLGSLLKSNKYAPSNRQIESISNSLIDDNKFNVKKKWLHDNREFSGVGKTIVGINEHNRFEQSTFASSNTPDESGLPQSTNKSILNSVAYAADGKAFGIVSKEIIDILADPNEDLRSK